MIWRTLLTSPSSFPCRNPPRRGVEKTLAFGVPGAPSSSSGAPCFLKTQGKQETETWESEKRMRNPSAQSLLSSAPSAALKVRT